MESALPEPRPPIEPLVADRAEPDVPAALLVVDALRGADGFLADLEDPLADPVEREDLVVWERWVMATWFVRMWVPDLSRGMRIGLKDEMSASNTPPSHPSALHHAHTRVTAAYTAP
jgi:hypothetical protein